MNQEPLFLEPMFQERIWGGTALADRFGYRIPSDRTGECWAISAHPNGQTGVKNGEFQGQPLGKLWERHPELFGHFPSDRFPLLTKILDANQDLSVQVHPSDDYAKKHENGELGKTECWYIIDCKEDAKLIYGHHAQTKAELLHMMQEGKWNQLLRKVKIKPGDFFYVPSGTIHALCEGTLVLETQQNSDTTYRIYDYDRVDGKGQKRELHLEKAIDVITVPHTDDSFPPKVVEADGATIVTFVENAYFTVQKWDIQTEWTVKQIRYFLLMSVLNGCGELWAKGKAYLLNKGDHLLIPYALDPFTVKGRLQIIVSSPAVPYVK
ncbi:mannose-6-phosphate isomerase, class I [Anoxybacteroides rupiense]|uniref:Mannose-6-phosphate isomerase n=1 Tax=Anoxybacteroides rupiense TaxID=311460 RepID=A0ABD5IZN0_9BACL|nr:mannose-6-phosphate isomerase, class I [Anoxybacillus rupiensis]MBB3909075.1 mannose-6-phosphate isomerase [Anoxybacillus rupiensis]MED5053089.1 mannose-6-phosphate isomerase, class I [Anoxybacillus rupiensis]